AMIGQSMINVKSGGRGRLSTFVAGMVLLFLVVALGDWVAKIPMGALIAVMVMTSIATFDWRSFRQLRVHPKTSSFVMIAVVIVVVATNNLAIGVGVGVLLSGVFFAWKVSQLVTITSELATGGTSRTYHVGGQIFFATADALANGFDVREGVERVRIDLTDAHFWDISAVGALDKVVMRFRREGVEVEIVGMNEASARFADRISPREASDETLDLAPGH
ncbi:MAG TPA: STAS domain-containing protein, partial [Thermomicrobiales bacterium]|nr:STAS domain-containing protein [Thermomicrobiales bacterium]